MSKLTDVTNHLASQSMILQDLPKIKLTVDSVSADLSALKAATAELTAATTSLIAKTDKLESEHEALKKTVSVLEARLDQSSQAAPQAENVALHHSKVDSINSHWLETQMRSTTIDCP